MWKNISRCPQPIPSPGSATSDIGSVTSVGKKHGRVTVDCSGANRGLFFGIFTLVGTIISMIVFFVLVKKPDFLDSAIMVAHISELVLYVLSTLATIIAFVKIRLLRFHKDRDNSLDEIFLILGLVGIFAFCLCSVVAGRYAVHTIGGALVLATSIVIVTQSVLQTVFIMNGLRRSLRANQSEPRKPGREYVTFLLVCNIGMWGLYTFEALRSYFNPVALNFYGFLPWSVITHVAMPLAIFYRFHSTVCLAKIWKHAYKVKLQ